jgi:hypothetical protein
MPQITDFLHVLQTILWEAVRDILNKSMKGLLKYCFESLYTFGEHHCLIVLLLVAISIRIISMYLEKVRRPKLLRKTTIIGILGTFQIHSLVWAYMRTIRNLNLNVPKRNRRSVLSFQIITMKVNAKATLNLLLINRLNIWKSLVSIFSRIPNFKQSYSYKKQKSLLGLLFMLVVRKFSIELVKSFLRG